MIDFRVFVVCRCGKIYRPGQEKEMWDCVASHVANDDAIAKHCSKAQWGQNPRYDPHLKAVTAP